MVARAHTGVKGFWEKFLIFFSQYQVLNMGAAPAELVPPCRKPGHGGVGAVETGTSPAASAPREGAGHFRHG